jgi:predicted AAA+ superfamily ATPase
MKSRSIKNVILRKSKSAAWRIIVLTGARQTGKTTLAKLGFPEMTYIALDDPMMSGQYASLTASQWHHLYPNAVLDEVQKVPSIIESVKAVHDAFEDTRYLLTGSSQLLLLSKVRETLAGRCTIYELFPLTLPEMLTGRWNDEVAPSFFQNYITSGLLPDLLPSFKMEKDYATRKDVFMYFLEFGGYPALVNPGMSNDDRKDWLAGYVRTYLERDIRDLANFRLLEPFVKIQKMTSLLTGELINFSDLAREAGVTANTAQKFLRYLEISYQTIQLQPWTRNKLKRLTRSPKLHYLDPGVQRAVIKKTGIPSGNEYESAIVAETYKQTRNLNLPLSMYHLRTVDGRETDLILETEKGYIAIEIKMSDNVASQDGRHIRGLQDILDKPLLQSFVLSNDDKIRDIGDNILALPSAMFLT